MSKIVEISPTTRHEGHSKLSLKLTMQASSSVVTGSPLPCMRVEKMAIGKTMDQAPKIASRVCGICPIAHTLAGIESMEASIRCEIPRDASFAGRIILQSANRLTSHALHNILTLPDMYLPGTDTKINPFSPQEPVRWQRGSSGSARSARRLGKSRRRSRSPKQTRRVGGIFTKPAQHRQRTRCTTLPRRAWVLAHEQMDFMIAILRNFQKRDWAEVGGKQVPIPKNLGYSQPGIHGFAPALWQLQP